MAQAELKTKATTSSVSEFMQNIPDPQRKADAKVVLELMQKLSGAKPKMWGTAIVGFVDMHLKYASGRELDWFKIGFSPRKQALTLYGLSSYDPRMVKMIEKLGKCTHGKGCVYVKKLSDIDMSQLEEMIKFALDNSYLDYLQQTRG